MNRIPPAIIELLERHYEEAKVVTARLHRARRELWVLGILATALAAAGLGAASGGFAAMRPLQIVASVLLPVLIARLAYQLGKADALRRALVRLSSVLGPLGVMIEDVDMHPDDEQRIAQLLSKVESRIQTRSP